MILFDIHHNCITKILENNHHPHPTIIAELPINNTELNELINNFEKDEYFLYILPHGGKIFTESVTEVNDEILSKLSECIPYNPEENQMIIDCIKTCIKNRPTDKHAILCETAVFSNIPQYAATYALPLSFQASGIKKYGADGLCHEWTFHRLKTKGNLNLDRVISIHLDHQPNIAAFLGGKAIESSCGFSPCEGIPSDNSCGDIDPSITLSMAEDGYSPQEISQLLSQKSGLTALQSQSVNLQELLTAKLLHHIGAHIAALGGVNTIVFIDQNIAEKQTMIKNISKHLESFDIHVSPTIKNNQNFWQFTTSDSAIQVIGIDWNRQVSLLDLL